MEYFMKHEYMPEFSQYMYQKYTPIFSPRELIGGDSYYQEFCWWKVSVCETLTGSFEEYTWVPMGLPIRGYV